MPEVPRAKVTVNFVVSISGNGILYFSVSENRFALSLVSICSSPTSVGTSIAHTGLLSFSPLRDTWLECLLGCHCEPFEQKHHPLLLSLPSFIFNIINDLNVISCQAVCWV